MIIKAKPSQWLGAMPLDLCIWDLLPAAGTGTPPKKFLPIPLICTVSLQIKLKLVGIEPLHLRDVWLPNTPNSLTVHGKNGTEVLQPIQINASGHIVNGINHCFIVGFDYGTTCTSSTKICNQQRSNHKWFNIPCQIMQWRARFVPTRPRAFPIHSSEPFWHRFQHTPGQWGYYYCRYVLNGGTQCQWERLCSLTYVTIQNAAGGVVNKAKMLGMLR